MYIILTGKWTDFGCLDVEYFKYWLAEVFSVNWLQIKKGSKKRNGQQNTDCFEVRLKAASLKSPNTAPGSSYVQWFLRAHLSSQDLGAQGSSLPHLLVSFTVENKLCRWKGHQPNKGKGTSRVFRIFPITTFVTLLRYKPKIKIFPDLLHLAQKE